MLALELTCAAIVALYVAARRDAVPHLLVLAVAGFIGEDSVIRAYGFYFYSPRWHLFLDRVPLMIVLIWPIVIHSAFTLARRLSPTAAPLVGAAIVLADASLIEPIAVHAGLWSWTEPGLFAVPPIGILGWAFFAGAAMLCLERTRATLVIVFAPLATHALLVASWWILLRWISRPLPSWPAVALAWIALGTLAAVALRRRIGRRLPPSELMLRAPGAAFFFVLLAVYGRDLPSLCAWSVAFAVPYLAVLPVALRPNLE
jgi:carotenoid biosynthesis protein